MNNIFLDDIDSIMSSSRGGSQVEHESSRRRKRELLIKLDELNEGMFLLTASSSTWDSILLC